MIIRLDLEVGEGNLERTIIASLFSLFVEKMEDLDSDEKKEALDLFSKAQIGLSSWKEIEEQYDEPIEILLAGINKARLKSHLQQINEMMSDLVGEKIKYEIDENSIFAFDRTKYENRLAVYYT